MKSSRTRWRILLAVASLLTFGAAAGVAMDRATQMHGGAGVMGFIRLHDDPVGLIDETVDLRPEQRQSIEAILEARQSEVDAAWQEAHARIQATVGSVVEEIAAELDADQVERFHQLLVQLHGPGHVPPAGGHGPGHVPPVGAHRP